MSSESSRRATVTVGGTLGGGVQQDGVQQDVPKRLVPGLLNHDSVASRQFSPTPFFSVLLTSLSSGESERTEIISPQLWMRSSVAVTTPKGAASGFPLDPVSGRPGSKAAAAAAAAAFPFCQR